MTGNHLGINTEGSAEAVRLSIDSCGPLENWLTGAAPYSCGDNLLIRVNKNADFDYLYVQKLYRSTELKRVKLEYAGIYCKRDGLVYDGQYIIRDLVDDLTGLEMRTAEVLHGNLKAAVRSAVETSIGNDRKNLIISKLTSEKESRELETFRQYSAGRQARDAYLKSEDEDTVFEFTYQCDYNPEQWTEESLLEYILDSEEYVSAEVKSYIDSHQESALSDFLAGDMVAAEYKTLINNSMNPVHRVKRIMRALSASSAKTVTVTVRKDGKDFTFKAEASPFRSDCISHYSDWSIAAADRREFERIFGRNANYKPQDILRIEYSRSVLYEAEVIGREDTDHEV